MTIIVDETKKSMFPKLMRHKREPKLIVWFTSQRVGVLIQEEESGNRPIGREYDIWEITEFENFNGTITLRN